MILERFDLAVNEFLSKHDMLAFKALVKAQLVRNIVEADIHVVANGPLHAEERVVIELVRRATSCHGSGSSEELDLCASLGLCEGRSERSLRGGTETYVRRLGQRAR
jgi:hypothetical protein